VKTEPVPELKTDKQTPAKVDQVVSLGDYINEAREILAGVPASLQLEILAKSPTREELYKAALEHYRGRAAVKEGQVSNG